MKRAIRFVAIQLAVFLAMLTVVAIVLQIWKALHHKPPAPAIPFSVTPDVVEKLAPNTEPTSYHVACGDCSYVYQGNPKHPAHNSMGNRDHEHALAKTSTRIVILGDSVSYGTSIARAKTYPALLEKDLSADVINTGIVGYTAYNEVHSYLDRSRAYKADVVLLQFCMNDVVDPLPHWGMFIKNLESVPAAAIPNPAYHDAHVLPLVAARREHDERWAWDSWVMKIALVRFIRNALERATVPRIMKDVDANTFMDVGGKRRPVFLSSEDSVAIGVLTDYESPEWRWLRKTYAPLLAATKADKTKLAILIVPLAYELEDDYPFHPEEQLLRFCKENELPCLDLLPVFKQHRDEHLYVSDAPYTSQWQDVWHLSEAGHALAAHEIEKFLAEKQLLAH